MEIHRSALVSNPTRLDRLPRTPESDTISGFLIQIEIHKFGADSRKIRIIILNTDCIIYALISRKIRDHECFMERAALKSHCRHDSAFIILDAHGRYATNFNSVPANTRENLKLMLFRAGINNFKQILRLI